MRNYVKIIALSTALIAGSGCQNSSNPENGSYVDDKVDSVKITKKFFSKLRNDALTFVNFKGQGAEGSLDKEVKGFSNALKDVTLDVSGVSEDVTKLFSMIKTIPDANNSVDGDYNITRTGKNSYSYIIKPSSSGTLILPDFNVSESNASIDGTFRGNQTLKANAIVKGTSTGFDMLLDGILKSNNTNLTINKLDVSHKGESSHLNMLSLIGESNGYKIGGNLSAMDYVTNTNIKDNGGVVPKKLLYTGNIENIKSSSKIDGSIAIGFKDIETYNPDSDDLVPKIDISGKLIMPGHPAVDANLGFDVVKTKPVLTFDYSYDNTNISGATSFSADGKDGVIELKGDKGIKVNVKIKNGNIVYGKDSQVTKDGKVVGTIEERKGVPIIKYTDGTFESLN